MRRWRAAALCLPLVGCATDLLVGGADTQAGTGSTSAATTDEGGDDKPTADGGGSGDLGTTSDEGGSTTIGVDGSTDAGDASSESGLESGDPTGAGVCEAESAEVCAALEGCHWFPEQRLCGPELTCVDHGFEDCLTAGECLWFGEPGRGECGNGPNCGAVKTEGSCNLALTCGWIEGACDTLPCEEQVLDACELLTGCEVVGPAAGLLCVPDDCLVECGKLDDVMCDEAPSCHFAGENDDGTCLSVECFDCAVLTPDECMESTQCDYNEGEMACQTVAG